MKKKLLFCYFIYCFFCIVTSKSRVKNGDPFDYISSDIKKINYWYDFNNLVIQQTINDLECFVIVFAYLNHCYGSVDSDFYEMALIYDSLKKNLSLNKKVKFYRAHPSRGFSYLLSKKMPALHIFHRGNKICTVSGKRTKEYLINTMMKKMRQQITKNINIEYKLVNGGDDGSRTHVRNYSF